jgi:GNAT superfamily N-acetyltransferase
MAARQPKPSLAAEIRVVPANRATAEDLQLIFGTRGTGATCQCQRYKLRPKESFASVPVEERQQRLRDQTDCGHPRSGRTSGLVGYLGDEPVGWCAVEPRPAYEGLVRVFRVPWDGRDEDRDDAGVWAITCLFTRAGYRRREVSHAMAKAAVTFAQERGAAAVEAYPMVSGATLAEEVHVGSLATFREAGMAEVHRPTPRRAVMRIDFNA